MSTDKNFQDYMQNAEKEMLLLYQKEEVAAFMEKIAVFYDATTMAYPKQLDEFIKDRKIDKFLGQISQIAVNRIKKFEGYEINYDTQEIHLIQKDGLKKTTKLSSVIHFLETGLLFSKEEFGFFVIASFLSKQDNFEVIQLFLALR